MGSIPPGRGFVLRGGRIKQVRGWLLIRGRKAGASVRRHVEVTTSGPGCLSQRPNQTERGVLQVRVRKTGASVRRHAEVTTTGPVCLSQRPNQTGPWWSAGPGPKDRRLRLETRRGYHNGSGLSFAAAESNRPWWAVDPDRWKTGVPTGPGREFHRGCGLPSSLPRQRYPGVLRDQVEAVGESCAVRQVRDKSTPEAARKSQPAADSNR